MTRLQQLRNALSAPLPGRRGEVIVFVNGGDPSQELCFELLRILAARELRIVELCVPFPRSITDGAELRESHRRALACGTNLDDTLALASRAQRELDLHVVLLADFDHTVAPIGLARFMARAAQAGVAATLVHALPAAVRPEYLAESAQRGIGTVMSCFTSSNERTRHVAYEESSAFTYVVSRFGRTGAQARSLESDRALLKTLRAETAEPLGLGFGIQSANDVAAVHASGFEAAIVGSAATRAFASQLSNHERMLRSYDDFIGSLLSVPEPKASAAEVCQ